MLISPCLSEKKKKKSKCLTTQIDDLVLDVDSSDDESDLNVENGNF